MNIYIVRHGEAQAIGATHHDFDRRLTPEGREIMYRSALGWRNLIHGFDQMVVSPLTRAIETAGIIKEVFHFQSEFIVDKSIVGGKTTHIIELANALKGHNVIFVGHEPDCSHYVSDLTSLSGVNINFKKGMIAKISFEGKARLGAGTLEFIIPVKAYK
ncbi:MAG: histidine phosphatase family protein [Ignavibacteria bacterium]|nr:histidine phosphatase family protein [Ignavibacteria bacterium]